MFTPTRVPAVHQLSRAFLPHGPTSLTPASVVGPVRAKLRRMPVDLLHALTIGDLVREHRRSYPERLAVVDGDVRLTWRELDDRVNRLADALAQQGFTTGDRILWL